MGSVARVHRPVPRKSDIPQIMAEAGVSNWSRLGNPDRSKYLAAIYERMGIGLLRWEFHWQQDGPGKTYKWDFIDLGIPACTAPRQGHEHHGRTPSGPCPPAVRCPGP